MGTSNYLITLLLLLLPFLHYCTIPSFCSSRPIKKPPLVLSLQTQTIHRTHLRNKHRPIDSKTSSSGSDKVTFSHNVSLTVSLTVGMPPQPVTMVLDTGSELSWLHCGKPSSSSFVPSVSKSYRRVRCTSSICTTRTQNLTTPVDCDSENLCHATLSYADATSIEGNLALETFRMGPTTTRAATIFGCMHSGSSSNAEEDAKTTGLLGMNRGSLSFATQMGFSSFSYCISADDESGILFFGEASFPWLNPLNYTPLVNISAPLPYFDRSAYTVNFEGIKVANQQLQLDKGLFEPDHTGAGQTMVDSGTQFTFLLGPVYTALRDEFKKQTSALLEPLNEPDFSYQGTMDLCYKVSKTWNSFSGLPTVSLMFRGAEMSVTGKRLLYRVPGMVRDSLNVYCFTFGNSELLGIEANVVGHFHQNDMWIQFDSKNSRFGFTETKCDLASQRLGLRA